MKPVIPFGLVLVAVLLLSCSSGAKETSSPTATTTPTGPTELPVAAPSPIDSPTAASAPLQQISGTANDVLNIRAGPGLSYSVKGQLKQGDTITITGKSADGLWWQFSGGWVSATYIQVSGDATAVPVRTPAP